MAKRSNSSRRSSSRDRIKQRRESAKNRTRQIQIVIGLIAVVILSSYAYSIISRPEANPVSQARLDDDPFTGAENPVVTLVEFGDFGCPSCKGWHEAGIFDDFLAEFGDKLQIVWRDLPIITAYSPKAAEAGQCAYDQGMFWEFHDITFTNAPNLSVTTLKDNARQINLDMDKFNQCLDSGEHKETVSYDRQAANNLGFRGTPSFAVNGQAVFGPNPDLIRELIQAAIEAAE